MMSMMRAMSGTAADRLVVEQRPDYATDIELRAVVSVVRG